ncbi:MAG: hypothetical protein O3A01_04115 [bacterium]|nr:hypothetical protein [bacterium]
MAVYPVSTNVAQQSHQPATLSPVNNTFGFTNPVAAIGLGVAAHVLAPGNIDHYATAFLDAAKGALTALDGAFSRVVTWASFPGADAAPVMTIQCKG